MNYVNKNPEYFLTIASERSVSKAAEKLYVSQSYLSQHIAKLEQQFNVKLFNRNKSPIELTEAGRIYASYLESCNQLYQKLMSDLDDLNADRNQTLRIGTSNWRGTMLLPDILPVFLKKHPQVKIELQERPVNEMFGLINDDKVDIVIMNTLPNTPDFVVTEILVYEKIVLAANIHNPATTRLMEARERGEEINLRWLENERFIMLGSELTLGKRVNNFLDKNQLVLRNRITTTSATTAVNLTAENIGYSFVNESIKRHIPHDDLIFFDLKSDDLLHPLNAVYKKNSYISPIARNFISIAREYYNTNL